MGFLKALHSATGRLLQGSYDILVSMTYKSTAFRWRKRQLTKKPGQKPCLENVRKVVIVYATISRGNDVFDVAWFSVC